VLSYKPSFLVALFSRTLGSFVVASDPNTLLGNMVPPTRAYRTAAKPWRLLELSVKNPPRVTKWNTVWFSGAERSDKEKMRRAGTQRIIRSTSFQQSDVP
jgi:hypothetical protein